SGRDTGDEDPSPAKRFREPSIDVNVHELVVVERNEYLRIHVISQPEEFGTVIAVRIFRQTPGHIAIGRRRACRIVLRYDHTTVDSESLERFTEPIDQIQSPAGGTDHDRRFLRSQAVLLKSFVTGSDVTDIDRNKAQKPDSHKFARFDPTCCPFYIRV